MKLYKQFILAGILLLSGCVQKNITCNGDLEIGKDTPSNWETHCHIPDTKVSVFKWDNSISYSGKRSMMICNHSDNDSRVRQKFVLAAYKQYRFSGYVKTVDVQDGAGACLSIVDTFESTRGIYGTNDWTEIILYIKAPEKNLPVYLSFGLGGYGSMTKGTAWFDNVSLMEVSFFPPDARVVVLDIEKDPMPTIPLIDWNKFSFSMLDLEKVITLFFVLLFAITFIINLLLPIQKDKNPDKLMKTRRRGYVAAVFIFISFLLTFFYHTSGDIIPNRIKSLLIFSFILILFLYYDRFFVVLFNRSFFDIIPKSLSRLIPNNFRTSFKKIFEPVKKPLAGIVGYVNSDKVKPLCGIVVVVLLSRLAIFFLGYLYFTVFENRWVGFFSVFAEIWNRWDAHYYIEIAVNGYQTTGTFKHSLAFFPLYPFIVRIFQFVFKDITLSGFLVSNLALCITSIYLYKLVLLDYKKETAFYTVLFLLIFPFSFFLGIFYTESLFTMFCVLCLYMVRKGHWFIGSVFGCCASLTRIQGVIILVPVVMEFMGQTDFLKLIKQGNIKKIFTNFFHKGLYTVLIPFGFFIYLLINKIITGNWFTFLRLQRENWSDAHFESFFQVLANISTSMVYGAPKDAVYLSAPHVVLFIGAFILIAIVVNKLRFSYLVYFVLMLVVSFSTSHLLSGGRYMSTFFPLFLSLGIITENIKLTRNVLILFFTLSLSFFLLGFVRGFYVM